jgi:hypothetical protein
MVTAGSPFTRSSTTREFDYKKGNGFASRIMWKVARLLFPELVQDIV